MLTAWRNGNEFEALAPTTQRDYDRYIPIWREKIGEFLARDIRPVHILAIRDELGDKPSTANHAVAVLSAAFIWGVPRDYANANPCRGAAEAQGRDGRAPPVACWALEIARNSFRAELRRAVALGLYTGQRLGDVLTMRLVDIEGDGINVQQSKTGKRLWIPIHAALKPEIDRRSSGRPDISRLAS